MNEIHLAGGRTSSGVVRIGNAVHRPPTPNSEFVRGLLRHLEAVGFDAVPRSLGTDESGRDVLTYIEGQVPNELGWYDDEVLVSAARLIRRYHDATAPLLGSESAKSVQLEVVCHNDLSPCNFVFHQGLPVAIIDFDAAAPGSRCFDAAYAAWLWLDIGNSDVAGIEQRRRVKRFAQAYEANFSMRAFAEKILERQRTLIAEANRCSKQSTAGWATKCLEWTSSNLSPLSF